MQIVDGSFQQPLGCLVVTLLLQFPNPLCRCHKFLLKIQVVTHPLVPFLYETRTIWLFYPSVRAMYRPVCTAAACEPASVEARIEVPPRQSGHVDRQIR